MLSKISTRWGSPVWKHPNLIHVKPNSVLLLKCFVFIATGGGCGAGHSELELTMTASSRDLGTWGSYRLFLPWNTTTTLRLSTTLFLQTDRCQHADATHVAFIRPSERRLDRRAAHVRKEQDGKIQLTEVPPNSPSCSWGVQWCRWPVDGTLMEKPGRDGSCRPSVEMIPKGYSRPGKRSHQGTWHESPVRLGDNESGDMLQLGI